MKTKISLILIVLFISLAISSFAQEPYLNLNGLRPIKKIKVTEKTYYNNKVFKRYFSYNNISQKVNTEEIYKRSSYSNNITFNDKGYIIKEDKWEYKYIYDDEGILILKEVYYDKIKSGKRTYIYDSNQKLIEENFMDLYDSILMSKELYEYNIEGNLIKKTSHDILSNRYYDVIEYDNKGKEISKKVFDQNDSLFSISTYKYDDTLLIESSKKYNNENYSKITFKYNKNNKLIEKTYYLYDTIRNRFENKFDEKGRIIEYRYFNPEINRYSLFEYEDKNETMIIKEYFYETFCLTTKYISPNYKKVIFYLDDKLIYTEIFKWDKWGNIREIKKYDSQNNLKKHTKYKYSFWY